MFATRNRSMAAAQRSQERRRREDDAPRLKQAYPNLTSLQIGVVEHAGTNSTKHRKHVVVATAPALFVIPCGDKACEDGGHDITQQVMASLRQGRRVSEGEHECEGRVGSATCSRRIAYEICAEFSNG